MLQPAMSINLSNQGNSFDLLCMQDGEYLFCDGPCTLVADDGDCTPAPGRLKLGSSSIYFVPDSHSNPIVRLPFSAVESLERPSNDHDNILDATKPPADSQHDTTIAVTSTSHVLISHKDGKVVPHIAIDKQRRFLLQFPSDFLDTAWILLQKLYSISQSSQEAESEALLDALIEEYETAAVFNTKALPIGENLILQSHAARVTPLCCEPGWAVLTEKSVCFQPLSSPTLEATTTFPLSLITRVLERRFNLKDLALEIFLANKCTTPNKSSTINDSMLNSSLYLRFESSSERDAFKAALQRATALPPPKALRHWTREWTSGRLSNYDYLIQLNESAGRSFNDLTQYPIFPWVLSDYTSPSLDLSDPGVFRDLSRPIAALSPSRLRQSREMYAALLSADGPEPAYMYGSHYSNPGAVVFYLVRERPELMLRLQNGRFDAPDRLFCSVASAWESVTRWNSDVKELTPDFYTPGAGAFLINRAGAEFGTRSDGKQVGDVELPPWALDAEDFLAKMAAALEAPAVSARLHKWINLVFGVKSRGRKAVAADNVFYFMTYDEIALGMLAEESDPVVRRSYEAQVREYGRTPQQLFDSKHPKRKGASRLPKLLRACVCGGSAQPGSPRLSPQRPALFFEGNEAQP